MAGFIRETGFWHDVSVPIWRVPELKEGETAEELLQPYWVHGKRAVAADDVIRCAPIEPKKDLSGLTKAQRRLTEADPLILTEEDGIGPCLRAQASLHRAPPPVIQPHPPPHERRREGSRRRSLPTLPWPWPSSSKAGTWRKWNLIILSENRPIRTSPTTFPLG